MKRLKGLGFVCLVACGSDQLAAEAMIHMGDAIADAGHAMDNTANAQTTDASATDGGAATVIVQKPDRPQAVEAACSTTFTQAITGAIMQTNSVTYGLLRVDPSAVRTVWVCGGDAPPDPCVVDPQAPVRVTCTGTQPPKAQCVQATDVRITSDGLFVACKAANQTVRAYVDSY